MRRTGWWGYSPTGGKYTACGLHTYRNLHLFCVLNAVWATSHSHEHLLFCCCCEVWPVDKFRRHCVNLYQGLKEGECFFFSPLVVPSLAESGEEGITETPEVATKKLRRPILILRHSRRFHLISQVFSTHTVRKNKIFSHVSDFIGRAISFCI